MRRPLLLSFTAVVLTLAGCQTLQNQSSDKAIEVTTPVMTDDSIAAKEPIIEQQAAEESIIVLPDAQPQLETNLWNYLANKQTLANTQHARVERFKKQFLKHPKYLLQRAERALPYLYYIIEQLEKRAMPIELAFTPMVESNFDPLAHSVVQAAGLWQFMPKTAKGFDIQINDWYDGRRDVVTSTKAALDYYQYLNKLFKGDWLLTVAAFNYGQGNVFKAIKKNRKAGKPLDYWSLPLPKETQRHIPKWIALSHVFLNAKQYSVNLPSIDNAPAFAAIEVEAPANLVQLAKLAEINKTDFYRLNPAFNRLFIPAEHGSATILVPVEALEKFEHNLLNLPPEQLKVSISYQVKSGDNLGSIAQKHRTNIRELKKLNNLTSDFLKIGQILKLPGSVDISKEEQSFFAKLDKNQQRRRYQTYKVRSGDSLWKIAKRFGVSSNQIARWNGFNKKKVLRIGQKLKIWPKGSNTAHYASTKTYTVKSGDSLYSISKQFKVKINQLVKWNSLKRSSYLKLGQTIKLYP